jgi:hypothetical protein
VGPNPASSEKGDAMKTKKIRTNAWVIFEGKQIPPGTVLSVGKDIDEKQAAALLSIGKEASAVEQGPEAPLLSTNKPDEDKPADKPDKPGKDK